MSFRSSLPHVSFIDADNQELFWATCISLKPSSSWRCKRCSLWVRGICFFMLFICHSCSAFQTRCRGYSLGKLLWPRLSSPLSLPSVSTASTVLRTFTTTHHGNLFTCHQECRGGMASVQKRQSWVRLPQLNPSSATYYLSLLGQVTSNHS